MQRDARLVDYATMARELAGIVIGHSYDCARPTAKAGITTTPPHAAVQLTTLAMVRHE